MKIGGYKNNPNSAQEIDLSPEVQNTGTDTETSAQASTAVEKQVQEPASQPEIQDTSLEIQETGQFDKPIETETTKKVEDDKSSLRCVIFKSYSKNVKFDIENGMSILCFGNIGVYEKSGQWPGPVRLWRGSETGREQTRDAPETQAGVPG